MAGVDILASAMTGANAAYLADLYARWVEQPASVDPSFADLFEALGDDARAVLGDASGASWAPRPRGGFAPLPDAPPAPPKGAKGAAAPAAAIDPATIRNAQLDSIRALMLIRSYRVRGHLEAQLDPLGLQQPKSHPELDPKTYGFTEADWDRPIFINGVLGLDTATIRQIMAVCRASYCGPIGVEFMHIQDPDQKFWIQSRMEGAPWATAFDKAAKREILEHLTEAEGFEAFCAKKYVSTKRFGARGRREHHPVDPDGDRDGGPRRGERDRHRHGASRPAQCPRERRQEALHPGLLRVQRRRRQPGRRPGLGRREVPSRHQHGCRDRRADHPSFAAAQPIASRSRGPRRGRQGAGAAGHGGRHQGPPFRHGHPAAWRRRLRRPRPGLRDDGDEPVDRLPHRRDDPHRHQQPDRLHHRPGARLFRSVLHRHRQGGAGADLARQRRQPGSGGVRLPPRGRIPPGILDRRGGGHRLLPPARPQRERRAGLHPSRSCTAASRR